MIAKSISVELNSPQTASETGARERIAAFFELTKPGITFMVVMVAAAAFYLGARFPFDYALFFHTLWGVCLLSSGVATLNQYVERERDRAMRRTANRPIPSGRITPRQALIFGASLTGLAELHLAVFVSPLTALLGLGVIVGYILLYTPLKTRTPLSTVVGAFPGAMPPLFGWAAANAGFKLSSALSIEAWILFAILFLWQFPHFLAIAWICREDYARAGICMLPVVEPDGRSTGRQMVVYSLALLPVSLLPTIVGLTGMLYFWGAIALSAFYLWTSVRAALTLSNRHARHVLLASVLYLPILFILMMLDAR
ncbi:heme o synthase [Pyrinomonas methylaliphatogenes]|uniref:Protoheme IX farnesyltransferase n=1 Tax=Pyrinomonas methylaliphatogenes TaxID=454194 RepID=A0A0B6X1T5_9BACT|nr:heme o synthase [Pyrinomonas methylaliphatogenes]CDM66509.1 protoheme IX farnesyltransferase [Pyrinomonas methylaliphatogenes]